MEQKTQSTPDTGIAYQQWLHRTHSPAHARRTASSHAAFLLPHLRPGMRLLDAGCGPGSITIGLAEAIAPGEATGLDANAGAIDQARAAAESADCRNVRFDVEDVYALPYADASFDAAFSHAVMQHLTDPLRALRELRRVLRPGGVIGVADADHDGSIIAPADPLLDAASRMLDRMRERSGDGDPHVGKRLRALLHEAGFERCEASATAMCLGTAVATRMTGEWQANYLSSPELIAHAVATGAGTRDEIATMAAAWRSWGQHPGAYWATFSCQAIGWAG